MAGPLRFEEVRIRRMPGFENEGFPLIGLCRGINVIYGPNGSGKTTTAKVIEALLWPRTAVDLRPSVSGVFRLQDAEWSVDLDVDRAEHRRNGIVTDPPLLPPAEERDRYQLSLHELLKADDRRFAESILREAAGGYDLDDARSALPAPGSGSRQLKEVKALKQANEDLATAVRNQRELYDQERELSALRAERDRAADALRRVEILRAAITHAEARGKEARAREALAEHPSQMSELRGDEHERLVEIESELAAVEAAIATARATISEAEGAIADAALPEGAVDAGLVAGMRAELDALRDRERDAAAAERQRQGMADRLGAERQAIGGAVDEAVLAGLDPVGAAALADFARRAADARARLRAAEAHLAATGPSDGPDDGADADRLAEGTRIVRAWLRSPGGDADAARLTYRLTLATGAVLVVAGLGIGLVVPVALAFAAFGALVLAVAVVTRGRAADGRAVHRAEYERLGLDEPDAWEAAAVERLLAALEERRSHAAAAALRAERRRQLEPELAEAREAVRAIDAERAEITNRVGVEPATDEAALVALTERISRWQAARAELLAAERGVAAAREQAESRRGSLRDRLLPLLPDVGEDSAALTSAVQRLDDRRRLRDDALREIKAARSSFELQTERRGRSREMLRALYERAGLGEGEEDEMRRMCEAHAAFREARRALDHSEVATREARARLLERGGAEDLLDIAEPELRESLAAAESHAARLDEITARINATETRVADAKKLHDIEGRLADVERLKDDLREVREREARGAIAEILVEHVRRESREEHLPAVFARARDLFGRITGGRYTLRLTSEPVPAFHAYDNQARRGRSLAELSSGTRVQLLLAVRVAFVESREAEARLPLILDEVLGNSDDERAAAVMDAVVELADDDRQIFYFTAQPDEVHKWGATLASRDRVEWKVIDLADAARSARRIHVQDLQVAAPRQLPAPDGLSPAEYARDLEVPRLDLAAGHAGNLHLWYLVPDPRELHDLLRLGPEHWGELEGFVRSTRTTLVDEVVLTRAAALSRAADTWFDAVRIGVGRPIDRSALFAAAGITRTFRKPAEEVRRRVGGDARLLLEAIEGGELKRFNKNKLAELREFLCSEGYIDGRERLTAAEVRHRVIGCVAEELEREIVSLSEIDGLIARLTAGAAS